MSLKALAMSLARKEVLTPALKEYLAKEADLVSAGKIKDRTIVLSDADMTIKCFQERKKEYNHKLELEGDYFHPSQLGQCARKMFFAAKGAPMNSQPSATDLLRMNLIFETGTYIHVLFQNLCERAGLLESRETAIINRKLKILGHADGIVKVEGNRYLLEIKTINSRGFTMLGGKPKPEHVKQMTAYMKALNLTAAVIVYINKDNHAICEFVIMYDPNFYEKEVRHRIDLHFENLHSNKLPEKEGHDPKAFPCSFCEFSHICWSTPDLKNWLKTIKTQPVTKHENKATNKKDNRRKVKVIRRK